MHHLPISHRIIVKNKDNKTDFYYMTKMEQTEQRDNFSFFKSFREQIDLCDEADQLILYRAITDFGLFHKDTEFENPLLKMAWLGMRPVLQKSWVNYYNGCNGGAPVGNSNAVKNNPKTTENNRKQGNRIGKERKKGEIKVIEKDKSIHERKEAFGKEIEKYEGEYDPETLNNFFQFYTQPDEDGVMIFEKINPWITKVRLDLWKKNK